MYKENGFYDITKKHGLCSQIKELIDLDMTGALFLHFLTWLSGAAREPMARRLHSPRVQYHTTTIERQLIHVTQPYSHT